MLLVDISPRKQAKLGKQTTYFTGKPCINGHIDKRYTVNGKCSECARLEAKQSYYLSNGKEKQRTLKCKTNKANWRKKNKGRVNSWTAKRYLAKIQRTPKWLTQDQLKEIEDFYLMAQQLETVFPWKQSVDHIVPLQGSTVSGLHVPWNLQILSAKANIQKGNKHDG